MVRFVGYYIAKRDNPSAYRFLKLGLEIKLVVSLVVTGIGFILAPLIADLIFKKPILSFYLQLAFLGIIGSQLLSFSTGAFQSLQRFKSWSMIQIGSNFLRIVIIGTLIFAGSLNITNTLLSYIVTPLLGFFVSLMLLPKGFLRLDKENLVLKQMFSYSKWVAVFTLIAAISARLDTFISARLLSPFELGLYGSANQLVTIIPQIVVALGTVVAPKMASMGSLGDLKNYLKKLQIFTGVLSLLGLIGIPVGYFLIPIFYGPAYINAVPIFSILLIAMLIFLFSVPIHQAIFYYFSYPKLFVFLSIGHMLIIALLGWNLISRLGPQGAAITVLVGMIFNFIVPALWVLQKINHK